MLGDSVPAGVGGQLKVPAVGRLRGREEVVAVVAVRLLIQADRVVAAHAGAPEEGGRAGADLGRRRVGDFAMSGLHHDLDSQSRQSGCPPKEKK